VKSRDGPMTDKARILPALRRASRVNTRRTGAVALKSTTAAHRTIGQRLAPTKQR